MGRHKPKEKDIPRKDRTQRQATLHVGEAIVIINKVQGPSVCSNLVRLWEGDVWEEAGVKLRGRAFCSSLLPLFPPSSVPPIPVLIPAVSCLSFASLGLRQDNGRLAISAITPSNCVYARNLVF